MTRKEKGPQSPVPHTRTIKLIPITRTTYSCWCQECESTFHASRKDAITCSNRCRSRRYRRIQKERQYLRKLQATEALFQMPLRSFA